MQDDDGDYSDWIEIWNTSAGAVNLAGWRLTDDDDESSKWVFPQLSLPADGRLLVYASNKDRRNPARPLHTNFKLDAGGEYLALVSPSGVVIQAYAPEYPPQAQDVSYGWIYGAQGTVLLATGAAARVLVPTAGGLGLAWTAAGFDDSGWTPATNGIGFDSGLYNPEDDEGANAFAAVAGASAPAYWLRFSETGNTFANSGSWALALPSGSSTSSGQEGPRAEAWPGFEADNRSVRFNGTSSLINIGDFPHFDFGGTGDFTYVVWFRPENLTRPQDLFGRASSSSVTTNTYMMRVESNRLAFRHNGVTIGSGGSVVSGLWHQAAVVRSNGLVRGWLNGEVVFSGADAATMITGSGIRLGAARPGAGQAFTNYFLGRLDEFSAWPRALSSAEVSNCYQAAQGLTPWYRTLLHTDMQPALLGSNASFFARFPFGLTNAHLFTALELRMRYDDGFAAYLNGVAAAQGNALPSNEWDAVAQSIHTDLAATNWSSFNLDSLLPALGEGGNVLAVQGLNASATNGDCFLEAQLVGSVQVPLPDSYLLTPTPGAANSAGVTNLGPVIRDVTDQPPQPTGDSNSPPLVVCATVLETLEEVASVRLVYRYQFDAEQSVAMAAGTGDTWSASISVTNLLPGQMVRWRVEAVDENGATNREPLYLSSSNSPRYFGTVAVDTSIVTALPVFQLFVEPAQLAAMDNEDNGARAAFFFDGEFYDNLYVERRGNTTASYVKKSHRLEFNKGYGLRHPGPGGRIRKTSLMAEYIDPSYLRQHLCFWLMEKMGAPAPFQYPVHVRRNAAFYQFAYHSDVMGEEQLARFGFDPNGALYKAAGIVVPSHFSTGGFVKKTREWEGTQDFDEMARAIAETNTLANRRIAAFDRMNLPEVVNCLAVQRFVNEGDDVWANMSLYRDSDGNGEWSIIPYDLNLSWGQLYYGNNAVYAPIHATNDWYKSHPLYGGSQIREAGSANWNRVYDLIVAIPETRAMLLRRQRALMDRWLQPPGTASNQLILEAHILSMTNLIGPDALADRTQWRWPPSGNGGPYGWGTNVWLIDGVTGLLNGFIAPRRQHLFVNHCTSNTARAVGLTWNSNAGIPDAQPTNASILFADLEFQQTSATQATEYLSLTNPNPVSVDLSDWTLEGAVQFTFQPGTVLPAGGLLYVSPDVKAFRARTSGPRGGQGLFVQGGYSGQLSARGEAIVLRDETGRVVDQKVFAGAPSAAQDHLRISELMYAPSPPTPAERAVDSQLLEEDFEYVELVNTGPAPLDLGGVQLGEGVTFTAPTGLVLAAGAHLIVAGNTNAFRLRYGSGPALAGEFEGYLDNGGERIQLLDATGEVALDFTYSDAWYPATDGLGFALVVRDEQQDWQLWDRQEGWRAGVAAAGSPGAADPAPPGFPAVLVNDVLAHTDPPFQDHIELFNAGDTAADLGGWLLTDDRSEPRKYRIPTGTVLAARSYGFIAADAFGTNVAPGAISPFSLSSVGDEVWLFSADGQTNLTGYAHGQSFGASPNPVAFGRHVNSVEGEFFVLQSGSSPGLTNTPPRVGPVVISEIQYQPPYAGTNDPGWWEYIELYNPGGAAQPLHDPAFPTNTWRLRDAVDFDFPAGAVLAADARGLVVGFDPAAEAAHLQSFREAFGIPTNVVVWGPWRGQLANEGETIALERPDNPNTNEVPYYVVETIGYRPTMPWPPGAAGGGRALHRLDAAAFADDPINWCALPPSPGVQGDLGLDCDGDGDPDWLEQQVGSGIMDETSRFQLEIGMTNEAGPVWVSWPAASGKVFRVECATNLLQDSSYAVVAEGVTGNVVRAGFLDTNRAAGPQFYRVRLKHP